MPPTDDDPALPAGGRKKSPAKPPQEVLAAVDLGSNSFHMLIARVVQGELHILDRMRETVRLAAGLDENKRITKEARDRALLCLQRFGQRVAELPQGSVRAVGTNTLRRAANARGFLRRAREALGHPIEVLPGREEARLIYLGVAHDISDDAGRRLVVDIGGGSTECILGERFEPLLTDSLHMGCVSFSNEFFPGGSLDRERFRAAEIGARLEMQSIERSYRAEGWDEAVGSSGTINAIAEILRLSGWEKGSVTRDGLRRLRKAMVAAGHVSRLELPGLAPDRVPVLAGGVAILTAIFDSLGVEEMRTSSFALREGLLYDLLGRIRHEDVRDRTIRRFGEVYHVDHEQSTRVERTALRLLQQVAEAWALDEELAKRFLVWAARLHEIGLAISYSGYHKHGAYLIEHSDMPGFSREDQALLATLVRLHRRKLDKALFREPPTFRTRLALRLVVLLRLSVLLNHSRRPEAVPNVRLEGEDNRLLVHFPKGWLEDHSLARADLEAETEALLAVGFELRAD